MREKPYIAGWIGPGERMNRTEQLMVAFLVVQAPCKVRGGRVSRLHGQNDARGLGVDELVGLAEHLPKHGRCGAGTFADTAAPGLQAVDLVLHRARYDQPHLFEPLPGRPVELLQRVALDEQICVHEIVESRSRHDASPRLCNIGERLRRPWTDQARGVTGIARIGAQLFR